MTDPNDEYLIRAVFVETVDNFAIFRGNPNGCSGVQGKGDRKKQQNGKEKKDSLTHKSYYEMKFYKVQGRAHFGRPATRENPPGFHKARRGKRDQGSPWRNPFPPVKRNPMRVRQSRRNSSVRNESRKTL